ncbi:cobalt-factor II C(20)-methyltransferase [Vibrio gazogenes]|uniref:Precorrin-2/cobalt-factor-2 C20-methyltransferase n=1 Tax=Vibrio gazogenes DSM 21264 = NBRC 103151 TaxID=1123492 RepID=A0A1M4UTA5_VIBGA|nr:cobalt-factor II C(20)-methyltransferase [Vibrio gazogenes]USP15684.1 cobalt-factor II C(20)-methyltransferase [Vibrio gazogenes]SHE59909.1 precorrin-2/cobalt-factor-2 C20-methyltransferase [Vibrio gazogenes DSM 21264] [Vibrio gazogenes DSM 21264 = NBRC 103151]SJN56157.1 Cobalt-precorrin-2 C(20)-methyltransferase [Vibrio gazogenes]
MSGGKLQNGGKFKNGGKLFAMGTGPGASDLITVRAARILGHLDVLYAPAGRQQGDSLALSIVREYLGEHVVIQARHFPMTNDAAAKHQAWDRIAAEIAQDVTAGKQVGFITLGDSMLFSTWVFLLERLAPQLDIEVVPGITSFAAIAAGGQFPLCMEQQSMAVMSCTADEAVLRRALTEHECVVLMKVYGRFEKIRTLLDEQGLLSCAILMANASMDNEIYYPDLSTIRSDTPLPYFSTILVNRRFAHQGFVHRGLVKTNHGDQPQRFSAVSDNR